jgi:hypothetical protein
MMTSLPKYPYFITVAATGFTWTFGIKVRF